MEELSTASQITLYIILALIGLFALIVFGWQIQVIRGKTMENCDGSVDSLQEHNIFYGMALADLFLACPLSIIGIVLIFINPRLGAYLLAGASFWFVWANTMTTSTSLRFEKPKITLTWFITFPFGALLGLAYFVWTLAHFDVIY